MKALIEAGIALLVVYLFVKSKSGETPSAALADLFGTPSGASGFLEAPGDGSGDYESGGSNWYGTAPGSTQYSAGQAGGGCCGTKSSGPTPTPTLPFRSTSALSIPQPVVSSGLVPTAPNVVYNYNFGGGLS